MPSGQAVRKVISATLAALLRWWEGCAQVRLRRRDRHVTVGAMNAGPVNAGTRRVCLLLAVAGSLMLMAGVLLGMVTGVLGGNSRGWPIAIVLATGLIAGGLFSGAVMVAVAVPGNRRATVRHRRPPRAARPDRQPDALEEWMSALRPAGPPPVPGPQPGPRGGGDQDQGMS